MSHQSVFTINHKVIYNGWSRPVIIRKSGKLLSTLIKIAYPPTHSHTISESISYISGSLWTHEGILCLSYRLCCQNMPFLTSVWIQPGHLVKTNPVYISIRIFWSIMWYWDMWCLRNVWYGKIGLKSLFLAMY